MPKHLLESAYLEDRANVTQSPYFGPEYVGAGPYRLKEWVLGSHLVAEANERYVLGRPKIDHIEVRDRQQIVDTFMAGLVPVAHSIISPDEPDYRDVEARIVRYDYDPRRAMEMLDGLGLRRGPDGMYRDAADRPLTIEVRTRSQPLREKLQQVIVDDWRRVGVVALPAVVPEQRIRDRAYRAEFPGFYFRSGNPNQFTEWVSHQAAVAENNYVGVNSIRYQNPEYDTLIQRLITTIPRAERMQVLGEVVHQATDQLLLLTVFHEPVPALISNRLVNVAARGGISLQAWNAHAWDVR